MPDAFTDVIRITKFHISIANTLAKFDIAIRQITNNATNEISIICQKYERLIDLKDLISQKSRSKVSLINALEVIQFSE